jgi:hypothetical protein
MDRGCHSAGELQIMKTECPLLYLIPLKRSEEAVEVSCADGKSYGTILKLVEVEDYEKVIMHSGIQLFDAADAVRLRF